MQEQKLHEKIGGFFCLHVSFFSAISIWLLELKFHPRDSFFLVAAFFASLHVTLASIDAAPPHSRGTSAGIMSEVETLGVCDIPQQTALMCSRLTS